jgi:hypothetical protein
LKACGVEVFVCGKSLARNRFAADEVAAELTVAVSALTVNVNKQRDGYAHRNPLKRCCKERDMAQGRKDHCEMLIGGVDTAGSAVAAQMRRKLRNYDLAIVLGRDSGQPGVGKGYVLAGFDLRARNATRPGNSW